MATKKIVYNIYKRSAEIDLNKSYQREPLSAVVPGCTDVDESPERIATFSTKSEALSALAEYETSVRFYQGNVFPYFCVTEYVAVKEVIAIDDDGDEEYTDEFDECGCSAMLEEISFSGSTWRFDEKWNTWDKVEDEEEDEENDD